MKILLIISLFASVATSAAGHAATVVVTKKQIQKDVWIANAKYVTDTQGNYESIAIANALDAAYRADSNLTSDQLKQVVHDTKSKLNSWKSAQSSAPDPSQLYTETLSLMSDVMMSESFTAAAAIAKDIIALGSGPIPEDDWRTINAFQSSEFEVNRKRQADVLSNVFDDAQTSPTFRTALDQTLGPDFRALSTDTADQILQHNPGLAQSTAITNLQQLVAAQGDSITLSIDTVAQQLNSNLQSLTAVVKDDKALLGTLNGQMANIQSYMANAAAQQQAEQLTQNQAKLDQLRLDAADAAFQIFGKIIPGPAGAQISQAGQVAVKIASSISNFVNNTSKLSTGLGAAVLTGNLLSAGLDFAHIFGGGPSQMDLIQQQLSQLAQQVQNLQQDMDDRLSRIDTELTTIYDAQSKAFVLIINSLNQIQTLLTQQQAGLVALSTHLTGVEDRLTEILKNMDNKQSFADYNEFRGYYQKKGFPLSQQNFTDAETQYTSAINSADAPPQVTSTVAATPGDSTITRELRGDDLDAPPTFAALRPDDIDFVLASAGVISAPGNLANPYIWTIASSAYVDLANQPLNVTNPGAANSQVQETFICQATQLEQFISAGETLRGAMLSVSSMRFVMTDDEEAIPEIQDALAKLTARPETLSTD